jgi:hypothetical protein
VQQSDDENRRGDRRPDDGPAGAQPVGEPAAGEHADYGAGTVHAQRGAGPGGRQAAIGQVEHQEDEQKAAEPVHEQPDDQRPDGRR